MAPLPILTTQLDLTPEQRVKAYHVMDQLDWFLSKERWLKGGWFKTDDTTAHNGHHTECLANFIRRVELAGPRLNAVESEGVSDDDSQAGSYASMRSITEGVVAKAIQELFPGEVRHMHFEEHKLEEAGVHVASLKEAYDEGYEHDNDHSVKIINPEACTLLDGGRCATCRAESYSDEVTISLHYGPFAGSEGDQVIPSFNDTLGTRFADVQRVIDRAREMISGVAIVNAADIMTEQERMEMEFLSIDAQADIDSERIKSWFEDLEAKGWGRKLWTKREAAKRLKRIKMRAEKDKEIVRQDCVNCT